jgi:hypothetical protein
MEGSHDDDEVEAAVLDALGAANANHADPTVDEPSSILIGRGLAAREVAAAADRLYRSTTNSAGALRATRPVYDGGASLRTRCGASPLAGSREKPLDHRRQRRLPTASVRCAGMQSARCCWTRMIR